jgi:pyridoxamine-phosphate oxidase
MSLEEVKNYINSIRRDFADRPLNESDVKLNPLEQYSIWFEEAVSSQILDPFAMCLSTASKKGVPSSRIVYMRDIIEEQFIFYTNYKSQKGLELAENPHAALNIHWAELERQIRIEGVVSKVESNVSDAYFKARPKESKIGAWASKQSNELDDRKQLEQKVSDLKKEYKGVEEIPRPDFWGGYQLNPTKIEFWQGRPSRLHDRIVFEKIENQWKIVRLSP